jgi:hypothetical protein
MDPEAFGGKPFSCGDGWKRAYDSNEVATAFCFDLEDSEAAFLAEEGDAFDQAAN